MSLAEKPIDSAASQKARFSRTENPLLYPLSLNSRAIEHFSNRVNNVIKAYGGVPADAPFTHTVKMQDRYETFTVTQMGLGSYSNEVKQGLKGLLSNHYQGHIYSGNIPEFSVLPWTTRTQYLSGKGSEPSNPDKVTGFNVRGKGAEQRLELRYHHNDRSEAFSEVEFGYLTTLASLVIAGKVDLSTSEGIDGSLGLRRNVFMDLYQPMLAEFQPPAAREEIYGLDGQIDDVETNLYAPLVKRGGYPMNTLFVGAPGVGKTLVARFEATRRDVVTAPVSVDELVHNFDYFILPKLKRVTLGLDLPVVLAVDDIERLLERAISVNEDGKPSQIIDPGERANALRLLERMQDTHEVFLLATLNHPDVEAAFLRRFNPIYFPLPTDEQRANALRKVIVQEYMNDDEYNAMLQTMTTNTEGFNYSGLSLIPHYAQNALLGRNGNLNARDYSALLGQALEKSKQRTSFKNLKDFDQAAKKMIGLSETP